MPEWIGQGEGVTVAWVLSLMTGMGGFCGD
ncbi:MAG: hypothetical protein RIS92_2342 [Verrucomicrobiota bacterium]|jgi:hypothetical protein